MHPVVARFSLYKEQCGMFSNFFKTTRKGILTKDLLINCFLDLVSFGL